MKQIKTIKMKLDAAKDFDGAVNAALAEGWTLTKREVLPPYEGHTQIFWRMLYAELEKDIQTPADPRPRCCETCKHVGKGPTDLPCSICDDTTEWEEVMP